MRNQAATLLQHHKNFISVDGTAEQTTLPAESIGFIVAAQAFHWFEADKTKSEFKRILKPGGYCCLIWNERLTASPFEQAYEQLLFDYSTDYSKVDHKHITDEKIASFYAPAPVIQHVFDNKQVFNFESLKGRLLSSSYAPDESQPKHHAMLKQLKKIFDEFNRNNSVTFRYATKLYAGKL